MLSPFRKLLYAFLPALLIGGCVTETGKGPPSPVVVSVFGALPETVQNYTIEACGFLPAVTTVNAIVAAIGGPAIPDVARQVAAEICAAVVNNRSFRRRGVTTVRGVPVRGEWVSARRI